MTGKARSSRSSSSRPDDPPSGPPTHLVVGVVGRAVGLRGEVEVAVHTDIPDERFAPGSRLGVGGEGDPDTVTVRSMRTHRDRTIVAFEEAEDRMAVEALRGRELVVALDEARPLAPDEYWDHDLVGCRVVTGTGAEVGRVTEVLHPPANDVLVVAGAGGAEHLIPLVRNVILQIVPQERIVIEPIPGLLGD